MNAPPEITRFEHEIMLRGGQSFRTSLTPHALHISKESRGEMVGGPSKARLLELVKENGRLRQELAQHKASLHAMSSFWEKAQQAFNNLKDGFIDLSDRIALAEDTLLLHARDRITLRRQLEEATQNAFEGAEYQQNDQCPLGNFKVMDKRCTIFPGTAGDPRWRDLDPAAKTTLKRSVQWPAESETKVLKKQAISSSPLLKSSSEPTLALIKTKEHDGIIAKPPPIVRHRILSPTYSRLASLLPVSTGSPWVKYRPILTEEQGGSATIAHSIEASFELVVIRCLGKTSSQKHGGNLKNASHANIVPIHCVFQHDNSFYFVYSPMSVPLAALQCVADQSFEGFEVAAVCKEILNGLSYVHSTLEIAYGLVSGENILLDSRASVKLANIGESMLTRAQNKQKDILDLGVLALKMSGIAQQDLDELDTTGYGSDLGSFVMSAQSMCIGDLQKHSFLNLSPGSACLMPRLTIAERQWFRNWTIQEIK